MEEPWAAHRERSPGPAGQARQRPAEGRRPPGRRAASPGPQAAAAGGRQRGRRGRARGRADRGQARPVPGPQPPPASAARPRPRSRGRWPACPPPRSTRSAPGRRPGSARSAAAPAHQRREARGSLHRRRVLPVLRGRTLGDRRRAQPVRHAVRPELHPFLADRRYADIPTLTFYKASYTSKYLAFTPVEWFGEATDASTPFGHVYLSSRRAGAGAVRQVRRRRDPVPGHREPLHPAAGPVLPAACPA